MIKKLQVVISVTEYNSGSIIDIIYTLLKYCSFFNVNFNNNIKNSFLVNNKLNIKQSVSNIFTHQYEK